MKTILKITLGIVFGFGLIAVLGVACMAVFVDEVDKELQKEETVSSPEANASEESSDSSTPSDESTNEEAPADGNTTFKLGDTVQTSNFEMTVSNKTNNQPDQYQDAVNQNIVSFDVEFKNLSSSKSYFSSSDFNLYVDDELMESSYLGNDWGINGDVNTGRSLKGKIYFDAPAEGEIELIYEPSFSWTNLQIMFVE